MGSSSLLLVVATALITWVISTFVLSLQHNRIDHGKHLFTSSSRARTSIGVAVQSSHKEDHQTESAPMQGGNRTFKKKLWSNVNMTDYSGISTTWKPYPYGFPCVRGDRKHMSILKAHEGILFQRPVKTGSTSLTAIILRLAIRRASEFFSNDTSVQWCKYRAMHASSRKLDFANRKRDRSYLISVVRDPTLKAISRFFHFDVSVGQKVATDEYFRIVMQRPYNQNDLTEQLTTRSLPTLHPNATQIVQDILADYDFIAVTERMDESLVVWKILFNLDFYDILYIRARSSGSFSNGVPEKGRPCVYLVPSFLTPGMQDFFESKEWNDSNMIDLLLYQAVYKSLDNTIAAIGEARVKAELITFRKAQDLAAKFCEGLVHGPCTDGGAFIPEKMRTCVIWSEGCDMRCLTNFQSEGKLAALLEATDLG